MEERLARIDEDSTAHAGETEDPVCTDCQTQGLMSSNMIAGEFNDDVYAYTHGLDVIRIMRISHALIVIYLVCSIVTFYSSAYSGAGSALDSVVIMSDVVCVDIISAFFVISGVISAGLYRNTNMDEHRALLRETFWSLVVDLYIAMICSLLMGSIYAIIMHRFKFSDVWYTVVECLTTMRTLDYQQSSAAPHSMNVAAWPLQSLVWCLFSTKSVYMLNDIITRKFPHISCFLMATMSMTGIILFTVFGMLHSNSNIFYANACSVTYRSMEFNLGVHILYNQEHNTNFMTAARDVVSKSRNLIYLIFLSIWWSEVGTQIPTHTEQTTCLRLYHRNHCLKDHHAFLLRGCLLAIVLVFESAEHTPTYRSHVFTQVRLTVQLYSAVAFCWPLCMTVKLVMDITFDKTIVDPNRAVVSMLTLAILTLFVFFYNEMIKPAVVRHIEPVMQFIYPRVECDVDCPLGSRV